MSNLRQAAQQALEVLLKYQPNPCLIPNTQEETDRAAAFWDAIADLFAALAEPEQELISLNEGRVTQYPDGRIGFGTLESVGAIGHAPAPRKPQTTHWEGCEAVHSECRKPEQEPVAWMDREGDVYKELPSPNWCPPHTPLYTAPTPRKPVELTDDEIALIVGECAASAHRYCDFSFARAVIAAYEAKQGEQT